MKKPLSLQISIRFSRGQWCGGIVSVISLISTISISLGVAVMIIALSAMNGFEYELNKHILAIIPHGEIEPMNSPFSNWSTMLKCIEQVPGILSAAPYLNFTGLVKHCGKLQIIQVKGVDPMLEPRFSTLLHYIKDDAWSYFRDGHQQIIIGKGVADALNIKSKEWLTMMISNNDSKIKLLQPKYIHLQVSGILVLNSQLDHNFAMVPLADAQNYLQCGEDIGGIAIKVKDVFNTNKVVRNAGEMTNTRVKIRSWIETYGYMYHDIQIIRTIIYLAMILVISVACFNIISTLLIAVKDKNAAIAILRTLGAKDNLIYSIFIWYGLLVGLTGIVIGALVGVLIALNLTILVKKLECLLGHRLLSGDIYFIDFLPTELHWMDVISVLILVLLLSFLASWYPARRASRINPVKILKGQ